MSDQPTGPAEPAVEPASDPAGPPAEVPEAVAAPPDLKDLKPSDQAKALRMQRTSGQANAVSAPALNPTGFPSLQTETIERFGHPMRMFPVAVSTEAMALAWANQEDAPQGATVVVDHEIRASGLHGRLWNVPAVDSLACSIVLRPTVAVEEADTCWLLAALAAAEGAQAVTGRDLSTWWPDSVVETASREVVGAVRVEVQLGPGRVKAVVVTLRFDLPKLGIDASGKDALLEAVVAAVDEAAEVLSGGAGATAAAYERRCALLGNRILIRLLPKGETRGTARHVDRGARLELESPSGMVEKIGVDQVRDLKVV